MKHLRTYLMAPAVVVFGSLLFSGCYTQFYVANPDSGESEEAQPVTVDQSVIDPYSPPPPPIFIPYPVYIPVAGITAPGTERGGMPTQPQRDFGNHRTPPPPSSRPVPTPVRGGASTLPSPAPVVSVPVPERVAPVPAPLPAPARIAPSPAPAPAPAPAAPAPARSAESRPAGGGSGRR